MSSSPIDSTVVDEHQFQSILISSDDGSRKQRRLKINSNFVRVVKVSRLLCFLFVSIRACIEFKLTIRKEKRNSSSHLLLIRVPRIKRGYEEWIFAL
ncbi:hypothetical protein QVD17_38620 [Tagetes erecta]|uniref:Uncharacterized protein n=1 Tax=Tagetes erecta TaxID=13708 RepID=A0AAD8N9H7_TARER|nr:hypothetical protein QVD17_38620 [Tagetes erecta]